MGSLKDQLLAKGLAATPKASATPVGPAPVDPAMLGMLPARVLTRQRRATMVRASLAGVAEALIRPLIATPADPNIDP